MPPKGRLGAPAAELLPSWMLTLSERGLSPKTLEAYGRTGTQFTKYLADNGLPDDRAGVDALHIRAFLAAEAARLSAPGRIALRVSRSQLRRLHLATWSSAVRASASSAAD
jgi:site-specific recombinase XerC